MHKMSMLFFAVFLFIVPSHVSAQIQSMKLLTPEVGWAAANQKLFWTTNGGVQWKDITPKLNHKWQAVSSVFFLNSSIGWVLLNCADRESEVADDTCFELASTVNSGESWSIVRPKLADPDPESGFSGRSYLSFADAVHGWRVLKISKNVSASSGIMLRTDSGGKTWKHLPTPPIADEIRFVTSKDGWLAGGPNEELYLTHDGGDRWKLLDLGSISGAIPDSVYAYDLPEFQDDKHGILPVTVSNTMSPDASIVVFSTVDGGSSWKKAAVVTGLPTMQGHFPTAVVGSHLVSVNFVAGKGLILYSVDGPNVSRLTSTSTSGATDGVIHQASFASATLGWVQAGSRLLSTSDGGATWTDVTPANMAPGVVSQPKHSRGATRSHTVMQGTALHADSTTIVESRLGFDTFPTPSTTVMQAWWGGSPFFDVFIYLYGSPNKSTNRGLYPGSQWISTVHRYGFGVAPLLVWPAVFLHH